MISTDEQQLQAWIDNELSPEDRAEFEQRLQQDKALHERAVALRELQQQLCQAYAVIEEQPAPRLQHRPPGWRGLLGRWLGSFHQPVGWQPLGAMMLCVALLSGGGGYWLSSEHQRVSLRAAGSIAPTDRLRVHSLTAQVLEKNPSGTEVRFDMHGKVLDALAIKPVRTFRTEASQYCREFSERLLINGHWQEQTAVACREDGAQWQIKARYYL